ncbi:hypothetical protein WICMUC_004670 [Wickerhamomyces mucosus]|uniref:Uncharacterized protein n=1 Tax=Wickerhamomyces mucosus TaxID=1378264 RepID=A0A9P8T9H5_9ASCO|nr:hypothetical protein WICMUC_004670 [Wickerhamomyces mucosus]
MSVPRRSSNNPFESNSNTDNSNNSNSNSNQLPSYNNNNNNNNNNRYYNSDEKRQQQHNQRSNTELPPSYEEVVPKKSQSNQYPREKASPSPSPSPNLSSSRPRTDSYPRRPESASGRIDGRTRHNKENSRHDDRAHRSASHRSSSNTEHRSREHRDHKERRDHREHREHRSRKDSDPKHRSSKNGRSESKENKKIPAKNVDTIDKLDVTGLFGGAFHHDGPFDACTPSRNLNVKAAPVMAFPVDGANNSIRGSNSGKKDATYKYIHGRVDDYDDYENDDLYTSNGPNASYSRSNSTIDAIKPIHGSIEHLDTTIKANKIHGETTLGLGSSTFLDGAPASKSSEFEDATHRANIGGLNRKKSLREKLKPDNEQKISFDDDYQPLKVEKESNSLLKRVRSLKVGRNKS